MNILVDINVVLDVLLARQPWLDDAEAIWNSCHDGRIRGHLAATGMTNIFYIIRRIAGLEKARTAIRLCLGTFDIIPIGRQELEQADAMTGNDLEDNVSLACALSAGMNAIVTRDPRGFAGSPIPILTPADLLALMPRVGG